MKGIAIGLLMLAGLTWFERTQKQPSVSDMVSRARWNGL